MGAARLGQGEGVGGVALGVGGVEREHAAAEGAPHALPRGVGQGLTVDEQVLPLGAEGAERGVAVVVSLETQLQPRHGMGLHQALEQGRDPEVGAEAVDAPPGRPAEPGNEALPLDAAEGEQVAVSGGKEVGLSLHAKPGVDHPDAKAGGLEHASVVGLLAGAGGEQVGEIEGLLCERAGLVEPRQEAGIGGVDQPGMRGVWRHDEHAHLQIAERVLETMPLGDRPAAVHASSSSPAIAGMRVGSALDAEVCGVAHQHPSSDPVGHG